MNPTTRRAAAMAVGLALTLTGCRLDSSSAAGSETPEGYHRMPNGDLMANVDTDMVTEYRDIMGDGILLPTHQRADGTIVLGPPGSGHNHPDLDLTRFPAGIAPVGLQLPRLDLTAPVVQTTMSAGAIEGPPVAGDLAWLGQTRRPGEIGPAVIGGVRELDGEPGAFARLEELVVGDEFLVIGEDGEVLGFVVRSVGWSPISDRTTNVFAMGEGVAEVRLVAWHTGDDSDAADYVVTAHQILEP